jgi:hypothetical protein
MDGRKAGTYTHDRPAELEIGKRNGRRLPLRGRGHRTLQHGQKLHELEIGEQNLKRKNDSRSATWETKLEQGLKARPACRNTPLRNETTSRLLKPEAMLQTKKAGEFLLRKWKISRCAGIGADRAEDRLTHNGAGKIVTKSAS